MKTWNVYLLLLTAFSLNAGAAESKPSTEPVIPNWVKLAAPSENHKVLETFIGKWEHTVSWWADAKSNPESHSGTNENQWIMDGRFVQMQFSSPAKGEMPPFSGLGITGYDNLKKEYVSTWIDNMGTGMMTGTAQYSTKTKTFSEHGTFSDPMTGEKNRWFRAEWKVVDKDNLHYQMYVKDGKGKEFKGMDIVYRRIK